MILISDKKNENWAYAFSRKRYIALIIISIIFAYFSTKSMMYTLSYIDSINGAIIHDPIQNMFPAPFNFSKIIFFFTYTSLASFFIYNFINDPLRVVYVFISLSLMNFLRIYAMTTFPLEAPAGIIVLKGPIVEYLTPTKAPAVKDLFFSGHTATMFTLFLFSKKGKIRTWLSIVIVVVPILLIWQRVHYSIDIVGGFVVGLFLYVFVKNILDLFFKDNPLEKF